MLQCPNCQSEAIVKNGKIHNGKQNHKCKECGRQFVQDPTNKTISAETWALVEKLLVERLPLAGISRVTGISERWLQTYSNRKYEQVPQFVEVSEKKRKVDDSMR